MGHVAEALDRRALARDAISYLGAGVAAIFLVGCTLDHMPIAGLFMAAAVAAAIPPSRRALAARGAPRAVRIILPVGLIVAGCVAMGAEAPNSTPQHSGKVDLVYATPAAPAQPIEHEVIQSPETAHGVGLEEQAGNFWSGIKAASRSCDAAWSAATEDMTGEILTGDDAYRTYRSVKAAAEACDHTADALAQIDPPAAAHGEDRERFVDVLSACEGAYSGAALSFNLTIDILDGDHRPSFVENVKQKMEAAGQGKVACVSRMMTALDGAGLPAAIIKK